MTNERREKGGFGQQKSDGQVLQPVGVEDRTERRVMCPMALRAFDPAAEAGHSEAWGRALRTLVFVRPGEAEVGRSFARSGDLWRSAGRSVAIVGRRAGARLCRGGSPAGPAGPGVTGCRRGASSLGYSAARAEAAAPPSGPEEPALPRARTAFSPAPTPTDFDPALLCPAS